MTKHWRLILAVIVFVVTEAFLFLGLEALTVNEKFQTGCIVALVMVTIFYALQTQRLFEEAKRKRDADFLERTILLFYRPLILKLDEMNALLRSPQTTTDELTRTIRDVQEFINTHRYMVSKKSAKRIELAFVDFIGVAIDRDPVSRKGYFSLEKELRDSVVEEWKKTEDMIRKFYGLTVKQDEKP